MTYSVHFRKKVLAVKEKEQLSFSAISKKFSIGRNTVFSWTKKLHPQKCRDKKAIKIDRDKLVQDVFLKATYPSGKCLGFFFGKHGAVGEGIASALYL